MLRKIRKEDRTLFCRFAAQFYASDAVMQPIPQEYHARVFEEMMRSDVYVEGWIFEYEGKPAGYALTSKAFSHESGGITLWIDELYIEEPYRSKGLGQEFFEHVHSTAGTVAARLRLEVEPDNFRAIRLYERMGFKQLEYKQMYKDTAECAPASSGCEPKDRV